jgi:hypothetical protein
MDIALAEWLRVNRFHQNQNIKELFMNFNGLSIGSIVSATEEQFIALYQHTQPKEYTQNQFVEEYKSKQAIATKDAEDLKHVGV